jgi:hypothetical protein
MICIAGAPNARSESYYGFLGMNSYLLVVHSINSALFWCLKLHIQYRNCKLLV